AARKTASAAHRSIELHRRRPQYFSNGRTSMRSWKKHPRAGAPRCTPRHVPGSGAQCLTCRKRPDGHLPLTSVLHREQRRPVNNSGKGSEMRAHLRGFLTFAWPVVIAAAITIVAASALRASKANATPGFARQTGLSCQACHTIFPELPPFGRRFKMNAYVFSNVRQIEVTTERGEKTLSLSDLPPLSVMLQGSKTWLDKAIPDTNPTLHDLSDTSTTEFPQALSLFYTGKIADYLGAFLQLTWEQTSNSVGIDNSELRFANHAAFDSIGVTDFIYGISVNNNPTSQDVWNSTPAWGYPFISTNVGVPPIAQPILVGQLSQESAGLAGYLFLFNRLYIEGGAYWSAQTS